MNWLLNYAVAMFSLQSIPQRLGSSITTAVGIAGVVGVFVGALSIAEGFRAAMSVTGWAKISRSYCAKARTANCPAAFRVKRRGLLSMRPAWFVRMMGACAASSELFVMINLPKKSTGTDANVPLRGVQKAAMEVRSDFRILEGRAFEPGPEPKSLSGRVQTAPSRGWDVGNKFRVGPNEFGSCRVFAGGSGSTESEVLDRCGRVAAGI